jgi:hypothetical protein
MRLHPSLPSAGVGKGQRINHVAWRRWAGDGSRKSRAPEIESLGASGRDRGKRFYLHPGRGKVCSDRAGVLASDRAIYMHLPKTRELYNEIPSSDCACINRPLRARFTRLSWHISSLRCLRAQPPHPAFLRRCPRSSPCQRTTSSVDRRHCATRGVRASSTSRPWRWSRLAPSRRTA